MVPLRHFTRSEFDCRCCGRNDMKQDFLLKLDLARDAAGVPFRINSGFRCKKHNAAEGGTKMSSHLRGLAADIAAENSPIRFKILMGLIMAGFTRIGIGPDFIHVDDDPEKPPRVAWLY